MKKLTIAFIATFFLATLFVAPANAQLKQGVFQQFFGDTFSGTYQTDGEDLQKSLPRAVGDIISVFIALIGVVLLVIIVYAGFLWLTAGGNEEQVGKAKKLIKNGIIGLIIALSAFVITSFVVQRVQQAVAPGGGLPAGQEF